MAEFIARPSFDNELNLAQWRQFHADLAGGLLPRLLEPARSAQSATGPATISICVYHATKDKMLRETLESLREQDIKPDRILVALDVEGQELEAAREIVVEFSAKVRFIDCTNFDAGLAFNTLAALSQSAYLLFLWSGATLRDWGLRALRGTATSSGADVLNFFHRVIDREGPEETSYLSANILGSLSESFFRSDLSPMPILVKAEAFSRAEGFSTDYRVLGCEQEFVGRCQTLGLRCTTALMEMGTVRAWDSSWLRARCYDDRVSQFRMIRSQIAAAPLSIRELLLFSKGVQSKAARRPPSFKLRPKIDRGTADGVYAKMLSSAEDEDEKQDQLSAVRTAPPAASTSFARSISAETATSDLARPRALTTQRSPHWRQL